MGYLICDKCKGYYKLDYGESPDDFSKNCECGGTLSYKEKLDFNSLATEDTKPETEEKIEKTVSKKDDSVKYCETCGQPLPSSQKGSTSKIDTKKQKKAASKIIGSSKERFMNLSTRNKLFSISGIFFLLALIVFFALPLNLSAAHYDKNNVSFDYPNDWNITSVYENSPLGGDPTINNTQLDIEGPGINVGTIDIYTLNQNLADSMKAENNGQPEKKVNGYTYYETTQPQNGYYLGILLSDNMGCTIKIAGKPKDTEKNGNGFKMIVNSFRFK